MQVDAAQMFMGRLLMSEARSIHIPKACVSGQSDSTLTDHSFAIETARAVAAALPEFKGGQLFIQAYTPPSVTAGDIGLFNLDFEHRDQECSIGIAFCANGGRRSRSPFDSIGFNACRTDPGSSGVLATGWDEAWLLVCAIGQLLEVSSISVSYGR